MHNDDRDIKKEEKQEALTSSVSDQVLARAEQLKKSTPNWKIKLAGTIAAISIPFLSFAFDASSTYSDYKSANLSPKEDLPDAAIEFRAQHDPYANVATEDYSPSILNLVMEERTPITHEMIVPQGATIQDVFKIELANTLFPELRVTAENISTPQIAAKINEGIETYKLNHTAFYNDIYDKYLKGVHNLNPQIKVEPAKILNGTIVSLRTSPIISELQLADLIAFKNN